MLTHGYPPNPFRLPVHYHINYILLFVYIIEQSNKSNPFNVLWPLSNLFIYLFTYLFTYLFIYLFYLFYPSIDWVVENKHNVGTIVANFYEYTPANPISNHETKS